MTVTVTIVTIVTITQTGPAKSSLTKDIPRIKKNNRRAAAAAEAATYRNISRRG